MKEYISEMKASYLKCSIVGDARVGKTRLTKTFIGEKEDEQYTPTIFENYYGETVCNGKKSCISIFDLPGQHDFDQMRKFAFKDSNVIVICYDVQKRKSFENAQSVWIPEIRQFLGKSIPIVLVGILSMGKQTRSVSRREAIKLTSQMLLHDYFEVYCEDKVEVSCLFSCIATIAKTTEKRNSSFFRRIFIK
ncbi:ras-like GTP-binding protein RhoL [Ostrea edulis]|uniref:ras-like GTP-binding protein RhoL n=1 Tax=Ostrea edulis TaxID=37623 RepID=UPI0024AFD1A8|nr:ras-like GTP-binding protein RhoL [Ostrea edulis]